jgi:hypothetical protein
VNSLVKISLVRRTQDDAAICRIIEAALPKDYSGNTLGELLRMIGDARKKGFDREPEARRKKAALPLRARRFAARSCASASIEVTQRSTMN